MNVNFQRIQLDQLRRLSKQSLFNNKIRRCVCVPMRALGGYIMTLGVEMCLQNANNKSYNNKCNNANCYESRIVMYPVVPLWGLFRFRSEFSLAFTLFSLLTVDIWLLSFIVFLLYSPSLFVVLERYFLFIFQLFGTTSFLFSLIQNSHLNESFLPVFFSFSLSRSI